MVKIVLPSVWTRSGRTEFPASAGALPEVIRRFAEENPEFRRRLLDPDGHPVMYINICIDDTLVPRDARASATVPDGSTITVIAPMAGG